MELEDDEYEVTGFDLASVGDKEVTIKFGPASETYAYKVADISEEIYAAMVAEDDTLTDKVPAMSAGVDDYELSESQLCIIFDEAMPYADAYAQYVADLTAAGYTEAGEDSYGDMHFKSPNGELDVCPWNYYDVAILVDFKNVKPAPTPANSTSQTVMVDILNGLYGAEYDWDTYVQYNKVEQKEDGSWYSFLQYSSNGNQAYFARYIQALEDNYLPKYLVPVGDAEELDDYDEAPGKPCIQRYYTTSDGTIGFRAVFNLWGSNLYLDLYTYAIA